MKKQGGVKWLDRALITSPYSFGLCRSEKDFQRALKRLGVPKDQWPSFMKTESADATVHYFECDGGGHCAIVCLRSTKGRTKIEAYGLLTHEAVHIWQAIRDDIGEDRPSSEFEAYSIQAIAQHLMEAYSA